MEQCNDVKGWEGRYNSIYKEYIFATIVGLIVLVIYKLTIHFAFAGNFFDFGVKGQDTKAFKNISENIGYYLIISVATFAPVALIFLFRSFGWDSATLKPWRKYSSDDNKFLNCLERIDGSLNILFQAIYGVMFCLFSDALENPVFTIQFFILITNIMTFVLLLLRSFRSRILDTPVGKPSLHVPSEYKIKK